MQEIMEFTGMQKKDGPGVSHFYTVLDCLLI